MKFSKKIAQLTAILAICAIVAGFAGCTGGEPSWDWASEPAAKKTGVTINVYNWGEYIAPDTNRAFTRLTGIKVNYTTYDENETMYTRLKSGATDYDVVFPSDYMIGKMIAEGMLQKLDYANIPNANMIDPTHLGMAYDPLNEYSVPYTWGTVGIFYNKKYVSEADLAQGWGLLWDSKFDQKIVMINNSRDAFGIALKKLGYSMNTENPDEIAKAFEELKTQKPLLSRYAMDEVYDIMIGEHAYIAPYYAGDGIIMMDEHDGNTDIDFFIPDEGTNLFVDAMCIPTSSKNKAEAEAYINFLCRTEVAIANAEAIGYSTPHIAALAGLDSAISGNPIFYPPAAVLDKTEVFLTLSPETNRLVDDYWNDLKR